MNRESSLTIQDALRHALSDKSFARQPLYESELLRNLRQPAMLAPLSEELAHTADEDGRFYAPAVADCLAKYLDVFAAVPEGGWLSYCYYSILARLFPENTAAWDEPAMTVVLADAPPYRIGRILLLQILRGLYLYERYTLPFDPTKDMMLLSRDEIRANGFIPEYLHMKELIRDNYIYEFMRIGIDITPFNTLGHIGGVHYVAMYMARQLRQCDVPVDLGLISGAAACHDIGKYGCRKQEERRVPYLHYFYTGLCCNRFELPAIGHIAANHSVWDLELENLSAESLLLIYADFRVKSSRDEQSREIVHFYTLSQAFDVILGKLDNVDEKKKQRYQKVYDKLADFEAFMKERGVITDLPEDFSQAPLFPPERIHRERVLMEGNDVVSELKYAAIDHNLRLMAIFRSESDFGNLIEAARSERNWKNVRTYISIFREYSTYMTEHQKMMTLKYLYELLSHREGDIRMDAAALMGSIVADFNDRYTKELPEGVSLPQKEITNLVLFRHYLSLIIKPGLRFTAQHRMWIGYCLGTFVSTVLKDCYVPDRPAYMNILRSYYERTNYMTELYIILLKALSDVGPAYMDDTFLQAAGSFITAAAGAEDTNLQIAALYCRHSLRLCPDEEFWQDLLTVKGLPSEREAFYQKEGSLYLDDLKMGTHWIVKVANIDLMIHYLDDSCDSGTVMHLCMHLTNLLKVSESLFVRQAAGQALMSIASRMTYAQRNEMAVELFNGLEIGDLQISKYVPEYLGRMILKLPPQELDEFVITLDQQILTASTQVASSMVSTIGVILEHFREFMAAFPNYEEKNKERQRHLLYIMIKAYAHYDKERSRDAFRDIGRFVFNSPCMPQEQTDFLFAHSYKKLLVTLFENSEGTLDFYSNAAVLNHIYRYISRHQFLCGPFQFPRHHKACFYPGTFDPFSLGHKAVACRIRDLGFDVYLALDEFSWSKHTQPRLMRRKIMNMSVADEEDIYPFPDDVSVNIANEADVRRLKEIFAGKELYIAVGTDVIENASAYKAVPTADSIHTVNHITFARETRETKNKKGTGGYPITGKVIPLLLDKFYEDISSTRIRENIDLNRDISNLIDAVAQNFIYDNNLYLREPAYKHVLEAREIGIGAFRPRGAESLWPIYSRLGALGYDIDVVDRYIERDRNIDKERVWTIYIDNAGKQKQMIAYAAVHNAHSRDLLSEFGDMQTADHIRRHAAGSIASIGFLYIADDSDISNAGQIIITEVLTELIARDYAYAVYHPVDEAGYNDTVLDALVKQGFVNIAPPGASHPLYAVDMKDPIVIFRDVETIIKNPFNKNPRVLQALEQAHTNLLAVMRRIYPGKLLLSFNTSAMHHKIITKMAHINGVSIVDDPKKRRGPYMSVPFGKALSDVLVPNTVTKSLHIEKYFNRAVKGFTIAETHHYSSVENQVRTIKSFNRPVILIDDLLHKGHRMRMLTPYLIKNQVEIKEVLVGVMTGQAMDMMAEKHIKAECAYYLPTLEVWLNERDCYPFIGGDSIDNAHDYSGYDRNPSVNLILPYVKPAFIKHSDPDAAFLYSLTCLKNARLIMKTLQDVYQETYEKRLTLKRLGEVVTYPRYPDIDVGVAFDQNMDLTRFIENDIERLIRLRWGEYWKLDES